MLAIKNVTRKYKKNIALDCVSLKLPNTGFVSLTGENGCGKTTLLNILATVDYCYTGTVEFDNLLYTNKNYHYLRNSVISYVQQDSNFIDYISSEDNVELTAPEEGRVLYEFAFFSIKDKINSKPAELSGGQKQKVAFIRGLLKDSLVLLVDEPTSNMDEETERKTFELLKELSKEKLVVAVSHNINLIEEYSDLIIKMENGKIKSVSENAADRCIEIQNNVVFISENNKEPFMYEWKKVKAHLLKKGELHLKLKKTEKKHKQTLDYAYTPKKELKKLSSKRIVKLTITGIFCNIGYFIMESLLSTLFILLMILTFCMARMDLSQFEVDMFVHSGYEFLKYSQDQTIYSDNSIEHNRLVFDMEDYCDLDEQYRRMMTGSKDISGLSLPFEPNGYFSPEINGFTYFSDDNIFELAFGNISEEGQILISDYLADYIISQGEIRSYADLIAKGVEIKGYHFDISGVISTNYANYISKIDWNDPMSSVLYDEWYYYKTNSYSRIYLKTSALTPKNNELYMIADLNGNVICNLVFMNDVNKVESESQNAIVNTKFAEETNFMDYFKSMAGAFIISNVVEDDNRQPTVYIDEQYKDNVIEQLQQFDSVNEYLIDGNFIALINHYKLKKDYPLSEITNNIIKVVTIFNDYMWNILPIVFSVAVLFSTILWIIREQKNINIIYAYRVYGYSNIQIFIHYVVEYLIKYIFMLMLLMVSYAGISYLINGVLTGIYGCNVIIMQFDIYRILMGYWRLALVCLIFVLLYYIKSIAEAPIKQYQ